MWEKAPTSYKEQKFKIFLSDSFGANYLIDVVLLTGSQII